MLWWKGKAYLGRYCSDFGMTLQPVDERLYSVCFKISVVVDKEQILTLSYLKSQVISPGETKVLWTAHGDYGRILHFYNSCFVLSGGIIHNNNLIGYRVDDLMYGFNKCTCIRYAIVADCDKR